MRTLALLLLAAVPARALSPEADALLLQGLDAAYRLDFGKAEGLFREVDQAAPEHPAGPFFLSGIYWMRFSQYADIPGAAADLEPEFQRLTDEALDRAKKLRRGDSAAEAESYFYEGSAYGMRGRWQILERQWVRAALNGLKAYRRLKKTVELDPDYHDAYLGLGMYDYYADTLPAILKLASIVVVRGDKERGLEYVRRAIEKGRYSVTEAKVFLVGVYTGFDKDPQKALRVVGELRAEQPDNPFYVFLEVVARLDAKDWPGAIAFGELLAKQVRAHDSIAGFTSMFDLYLGEAYLANKDHEEAAAVFDRCIAESKEPRRASVTYCYLRRAQVRDLQGRRDEALADYRLVLERPDVFESRGKAKHGLKDPVSLERVIEEILE